jgi:hypothetical protein
MAKLSLMFEDKVVKEVPVGSRPISIGRSPDNDLAVDNLAVSNHHARVYFEAGRLVVEDLDSLNGTFVNDLRVERAALIDLTGGNGHVEYDASLVVNRGVLLVRWLEPPVPAIRCHGGVGISDADLFVLPALEPPLLGRCRAGHCPGSTDSAAKVGGCPALDVEPIAQQ